MNIVKSIYGDEKYTPPFHCAYFLYFQLAHCSILLGNLDKTFEYLEMQYEYCKVANESYNKITQFVNIPSIRYDKFECCADRYHIEEYIDHFKWSAYNSIREDERFKTIYEKAKKLNEYN